MAEDKKPLTNANVFEELVFLLAGLLILGYLMTRAGYFLGLLDASGLTGFWQAIVDFFTWFWPIWKVAVIILVAACIAWAIYSYLKLQEVESEEEKIYGKTSDDAFLDLVPETIEERKNEKWQRVTEHANSNNPADWRLSIIEADVMLEEALRIAGYYGDGVGEMLKSVDPSDLLTLDAAWEAHKVRNRIAHSGGDFQLTERETKRVISLFESVFREFQII